MTHKVSWGSLLDVVDECRYGGLYVRSRWRGVTNPRPCSEGMLSLRARPHLLLRLAVLGLALGHCALLARVALMDGHARFQRAPLLRALGSRRCLGAVRLLQLPLQPARPGRRRGPQLLPASVYTGGSVRRAASDRFALMQASMACSGHDTQGFSDGAALPWAQVPHPGPP